MLIRHHSVFIMQRGNRGNQRAGPPDRRVARPRRGRDQREYSPNHEFTRREREEGDVRWEFLPDNEGNPAMFIRTEYGVFKAVHPSQEGSQFHPLAKAFPCYSCVKDNFICDYIPVSGGSCTACSNRHVSCNAGFRSESQLRILVRWMLTICC